MIKLICKRVILSFAFPLAFLLLAIPRAGAQFQPPAAPGSAFSIPADHQIQPQQLNSMLQMPAQQRPLILQVGSHLMFSQAHIQGAEYAGPGSQPAGLELLRKRVASVPKDKLIVLYCGCCPWDRCPNVGPAFKLLLDSGFTNVRVLYLAQNFGDDWAAKGYSVDSGH